MTSIDTVSDLPSRRQYVAATGQTEFDYPFPIFEDADLVVDVDGVNPGLDVGYTVTGAGDDTGGTIVTDAMAGGEIVTVYRDIPIARATDVSQDGPWDSTSYNDELDRITLVQQQLATLIKRAIRLPMISTVTESQLLLDPATYASKLLAFDANGSPTPLSILAAGTVLTSALIGTTLDSLIRTAEETTAGVTPSNYAFEVGHPKRYGAVLDGVTDDTAALIRWASVKGRLVFPVGTALVSAHIPLGSNTTITAAKGATITTATGDISLLYATGKSNITITGLNFTQTVAGSAAYIGHVALVDCTDCRIENCTSDGYQWCAFYIDGGLRCYVMGNHITGSTGTVSDSADITLYRQCNYCTVAFNKCFGTGKTGIFVQDPYSLPQLTPFKNTVTHNKVGAHAAYGIVLYLPARSALGGINSVNPGTISAAGSAYTDGQYNGVAVTALTGSGNGATANVTVAGGVVTAFYTVSVGGNYADGDTVTVVAGLIGGTGSGFILTLSAETVCQPLNTYNEISHNVIQDIIGTFLAGASGMGLYVVGAGIGGTKLIGNTVKNCCVSSSGGALAQAAITVAGLPAFAGNAAVELIGNSVAEHSQYQGIYISGMQAPVVISGGGITLPSTNTTGAALRITNSSNVSVGGGISIVQQGSGQGVLVQSLTVASSKISFGLMQVVSAAGTPFSVTRALGLTVPDFKLLGADISTTSTTPNGLSVQGITDGVISSNKISVGGQSVLNFQDCTGTVVDGNVWKRLSGTVVVTFGGTGSGNIFTKSNRGVAANGAVVNGASAGMMIELNGNAAPLAGTWAVGDRVNQSVPVDGVSPVGWRCTVSNSPGTWKAEATL